MRRIIILMVFINIILWSFVGGLLLSRKSTPVIPTPTPTVVFNPYPYKLPQIQKQQSYTTLLAGDSMLASLGVNANALRLKLISYYPSNEFVNYNYGFPATNIESLPERLRQETTDRGSKYKAILEMDVDMIMIDSFGYNPLSQYPLTEGLKKQEQILDETIREIISKKPETAVAIITPIAPNSKKFAQGVYNISTEERQKWVAERVAYIQNAIDFANSKGIPLINVYAKSLVDGDGDLKYIDAHDYIHPSKLGTQLMADTIAEFIFQNKIFPE